MILLSLFEIGTQNDHPIFLLLNAMELTPTASATTAAPAPVSSGASKRELDDSISTAHGKTSSLTKFRSSAMAVAGMARIKRQNRVRDNVDSIVHSIGTLHAELSVGSSARTVGTGLKVRTLVSRTKARGDGADTPVAAPARLKLREVTALLRAQEQIASLLDQHGNHHAAIAGSPGSPMHATSRSPHKKRSIQEITESHKELDGLFSKLQDAQKMRQASGSRAAHPSLKTAHPRPEKRFSAGSAGKPKSRKRYSAGKTMYEEKVKGGVEDGATDTGTPGDSTSSLSSSLDLMEISAGHSLPCCCAGLNRYACCRGVTDYERAAVLIDDAIHLRSPMHDMESMFQVRTWLIMGNWWWRKIIQIITIAFVVILPFASIPFYGIERGHHISLDKSIGFEWACLTFIVADLALRGYTYGGYMWAHHHLYKIACVTAALHLIDLIMATSHASRVGFVNPSHDDRTVHPGVVLRWSEILRVFFIPYHFSKLRRYFVFTMEAIFALRHVAFFLTTFLAIWVVAAGLAFPTRCSIPQVYVECLQQESRYSNESLFDATLQCGQAFDETGVIDGPCGTSFYKTHSGALLAESGAYLKDTHSIIMQMLFLLLGCVNFPDIALPVSSLTNRVAFMGFALFIVIMIVVILSLVLSVIFYEFQVSFGQRYDKDWKQYLSTLLRSLALVSSNEDGGLDRAQFKQLFNEYKALWGTWVMTEDSHVDLDKVFSGIDEDASGIIDKWEFVNVCKDIYEEEGESWILTTHYDVSAQHLDALEKYEFMMSDMSMKRSDAGGTAASSATETKTTKRSDSTIKQDSFRAGIDELQQEFDRYASSASCCERLCIGGLYPRLRRLIITRWFRWIIQLTIYTSVAFAFATVVVKYETDCSNPQDMSVAHGASNVFQIAEYVFAAIFTLEMVLKILAVGYLGYWNTLWWRFDFFLTVLCLLDIGVATYVFVAIDNKVHCGDRAEFTMMLESLRRHFFFRSARCFRAIRILRYFTYDFHLRRIFRRIMRFLPEMMEWTGLLFTLMYPYAVIGVYLWAGKLHFKDPSSLLANTAYATAGSFTFNTHVYGNTTTTVVGAYARIVNFDDFLAAFFTLFSLSFENNWHVIYEGVASVTDNGGDQGSNKWAVAAYFVTWIVLSTLVVMNLLIAHFLQTFDRHSSNDAVLTSRWRDVISKVSASSSKHGDYVHSQTSFCDSVRQFLCGYRCALTGADLPHSADIIFSECWLFLTHSLIARLRELQVGSVFNSYCLFVLIKRAHAHI